MNIEAGGVRYGFVSGRPNEKMLRARMTDWVTVAHLLLLAIPVTMPTLRFCERSPGIYCFRSQKIEAKASERTRTELMLTCTKLTEHAVDFMDFDVQLRRRNS